MVVNSGHMQHLDCGLRGTLSLFTVTDYSYCTFFMLYLHGTIFWGNIYLAQFFFAHYSYDTIILWGISVALPFWDHYLCGTIILWGTIAVLY